VKTTSTAMSKRQNRQQQEQEPPHVNTSIRPRTKELVKLAAPFVSESITDFLSSAADRRALEILDRHNVRLPAHLAALG
jgi:uncharacterized protein (DUF1778 family)